MSVLDLLPSLHARPECDAELVAWRLPAGPRLTVVAKIGFALETGETKALLPYDAGGIGIVDRDRHYDRSPTRSVEEASDLAPLIPGAEVLVVGHAYCPRGLSAPSLPVQIQVARKGVVLLKKKIAVVGDRRDNHPTPMPFQRMPLRWERAIQTDSNPVGVDLEVDAPNLINPDDPDEPAGLGPVGSIWPTRRARLGNVPRSVVEADVIDLPAGFDFNFFRAAPDDQRLQELKGDEWLALDGLHPLLPRLELRLPGVLVIARLSDPHGRPLKAQPLLPDRLVLDTDRQRGTLTYRAAFALDWSTLAGHRIEVGLSRQEDTVSFPEVTDPSSLRRRVRSAVPAMVSSAGGGVPRSGSFGVGLPTTEPPERALASMSTMVGAPVPAPRAADSALPFGGASAPPLPFSDPNAAPPSWRAPVSMAAPPVHVAPPPVVAAPPIVFADPVTQDVAPPSRPVRALSPTALEADDADEPRTMTVDSFLLKEKAVPFAGAIAAGAAVTPAVTEGLPFASTTTEKETDEGLSLEREGDVVPAVSDVPLAIGSTPWQLKPPQDALIIAVKGTFELVPDKPATFREEPEVPLGDVFVDDDIEKALVQASDFALLKTEVDVLVRGSVYAPGGKATAMRASMRLRGAHATLDRSIAVFGDRQWQGGALQLVPTNPESFEKIPLTWERSFGGKGYDGNPQGVGYKGEPGADGLRRLPNFEEIGRLVKSPGDTPTPAGLGPMHPQWKSRVSMLGTYDVTWFKTRWPYYPINFDFRYFQAAPPSQRLPKVDGDEEYELVGLHPEHPSLRGRLPMLKVRLFVVKTKASGGGFREVPAKLDTITFTPDENCVHLVWRGSLDVSDDDAPELSAIFATVEPTAGPALTMDEVRARFRKATTDEPTPAVAPPAPEPEVEAAPDEDDELRAKIEAELAAKEAEINAMRPPDADADPPPPQAPDPEKIAAAMKEAGASDEEIAEIRAALRGSTTEPPPPPDPTLRELVLHRLEEGESLSGLELVGADLSDLDLSAQSLQFTDLSRAKLDRANLSSTDASNARLSGASLVGANLGQALFLDADLTDADISETTGSGAVFDRAEAAGLKAHRANLTGAMLSNGIFTKADFTGATLDGADLTEADLSGARLDRATFKDATMPAARLYGACASKATFDRANMHNVRAEAAVLTDCSFADVECDESIWERADVSKSTFFGASLKEASFLRATCHSTIFNAVDLSNGRLRKSRMQGAHLLRANLMKANCDRANFHGADLRGANLHGTSLLRTILTDTKMDEAIISYSDLDRRQPV